MVKDAAAPAPPPALPEEPHVEELEPISSLDASVTPTYQRWLPRPWQEWWLAFKANIPHTLAHVPSRAFARIPTRSLVIVCVLLLLTGTVITTVSDQGTNGGDRQSILGAVLVDIGFFGLVALAVRAAYTMLRIQFERLRD